MLIKLLKQALRRPARQLPPTEAPRQTALLDRVATLCGHDMCREAAFLLQNELGSPSTADAARQLVESLVLPVMLACQRCHDTATACELETMTYLRLIRAFEEPEHYNACFSLLDRPLRAMGQDRARQVDPPDPTQTAVSGSLLFFVHNLGHDQLAHVQLLADLLDAQFEADPESIALTGIVGVAGKRFGKRVQDLIDRWKVRVWPLPPSLAQDQVYEEVVALLHRESFARLVFTSVPTGLSFVSGLADERLVWLSMKFELSCFVGLTHRCSFTAGHRTRRVVDGQTWLAAPPLFRERASLSASANPPGALQQARRFGTIYYTVNRTEKIRNPTFLSAVAAILHAVPDSCFVWTGKLEDPTIGAFFQAAGLHDRHFFAGWVAPDDLLLEGHVFIDTPVLSGAVAARAVATGCAVVTWSDAKSWVNFFLPTFESRRLETRAAEASATIERIERLGLSLECADQEAYVAQAVRLGVESDLRRAYGAALAAFASTCYFDKASSAQAHFANLRGEPLLA